MSYSTDVDICDFVSIIGSHWGEDIDIIRIINAVEENDNILLYM